VEAGLTGRVAAAAEEVHQLETQPPSMMCISSCTIELFVCVFMESYVSHSC
jgi:hypothetical protein